MTEKPPEIRFERRGRLGVVVLDRIKALNALSLEMIHAMAGQLTAWADDDAVGAVVVISAGGKGFCAGGDVVAMYQAGTAASRGEGDGAYCREFFWNEYQLDYLTATYPKPYVCLIDGVFMGGGVGISAHGRHRVVSENALFAMPETGIGLFPDVGGSYLLPRLPGQIGTYLGLSGARLRAADLCYAGIATAFVPAAAQPALLEALTAGDGWADTVAAAIAGFAQDPGPAPLAVHRDTIDHCFAADTVEAIFAALAADSGTWAAETLAAMQKMSPTSLKLSLEAARRGAKMSLEACLVMEYRLSQGCMAGHDFYEGVRALLVDKDRNPRWSPATLAEVTPSLIERHFATPPAGDLVLRRCRS